MGNDVSLTPEELAKEETFFKAVQDGEGARVMKMLKEKEVSPDRVALRSMELDEYKLFLLACSNGADTKAPELICKAATVKNSKFLRFLLERTDAKVNARAPESHFPVLLEDMTPLILAAHHGNLDNLRVLCLFHASLSESCPSNSERPSLQAIGAAMLEHHYECVEYLALRGSPLEGTYDCPLMMNIPSIEYAKLLIEYGAEITVNELAQILNEWQNGRGMCDGAGKHSEKAQPFVDLLLEHVSPTNLQLSIEHPEYPINVRLMPKSTRHKIKERCKEVDTPSHSVGMGQRIILEGVLTKQGGSFKTWKIRRFSLQMVLNKEGKDISPILIYWKEDDPIKCLLKIVLLEDYAEVEDIPDLKSHPFCFVLKNDRHKRRTFVFSASSAEEREKWKAALTPHLGDHDLSEYPQLTAATLLLGAHHTLATKE